MSNGEKGAVAGGALGAGTGALIGSATHHTGAGAVIGTAVGAIAGGLTGHAIDESERKQDAKLAAATAPPAREPLRYEDIVQMTRQAVSDDIIITQIRTSNTIFNMTANEITWLKQNGVSDAVIREMQMTPYRQRRVYQAVPVEPVYVRPAPPPPVVGVGIGATFR
jgi:hypothetical protein